MRMELAFWTGVLEPSLDINSCHFMDLDDSINALFNDALNTFYLRLYGVRHGVKDPSDSKRGNPLPLHGLLFRGERWTGYHIPRP